MTREEAAAEAAEAAFPFENFCHETINFRKHACLYFHATDLRHNGRYDEA